MLALPDTLKLINVPVLVILGCAPVSKSPDIVVVVIVPATPKLPTLALPDALSVVANTPVVPKLPVLALPLALNVPVTFVPVDVTTNTFATPPTLVVTLPLAPIISTLLVPFAIEETLISPAFKLPVTDRFVTVIVADVLLKTKLALPLIAPLSLKNTCVFEP